MHQTLTRQVEEALVEPDQCVGLACASALRVAAATLNRLEPDEKNATTVVGVLGADDVDSFKKLVAQIVDQYDVDATVSFHVGSFAVRFSPRPQAPESTPDESDGTSLWRPVLPRWLVHA